MNIKETKKPSFRIDTRYVSSLGIKSYDADNLYPQNVRAVVAASSTASTCYDRYANFIEGNGLTSQVLSEFVSNRAGDTVDDIHHLCSEDIAMHNGFAIHVNYNLLGEIVEMYHVPFENCRLEEEDENGFVANVVLHPDWRGQKTRNGKQIKINADNIDIIPMFNPDPAIVQSQIMRAGGIEFYTGQILWVSRKGKTTYPVPTFDAVLTEMSTDEGLSNVKNRNVRNNFMTAGMLVHKKSQSSATDSNDDVGYSQELAKLQGDTNSVNLLEVEIETDEDEPKFVSFKGENYDKEFTVTDASVGERIYSAFGQETFHCIRIGKVGFSGDIVNDAKLEYSQRVLKEQRMLTRAYTRLFSHWTPGELPLTEGEIVEIEPIVKAVENTNVSQIPSDVLKDLTANERRSLVGFKDLKNNANEQQLLAEKLGVGGTQSLVAIMTDITLSAEQKGGLMKTLFGFTDEQIKTILGDAING